MQELKWLRMPAIAVFSIVFCVSLMNREAGEGQNTRAGASKEDRGKALAMQYCGSCHLFPEPGLLDKKTWMESVLPNMAWRMGIRTDGEGPYDGMDQDEVAAVKLAGVYPEEPVMSAEDWKLILSYYEKEAPGEMPVQHVKDSVYNSLPLFEPSLAFVGDNKAPKTTLLKFDKRTSRLYVGDDQNSLYVLNGNLDVEETWWMDSAPVDIDFPESGVPRILTIGSIRPSEQKKGRWMALSKGNDSGINVKNLPRPVRFYVADLNSDEKEDVLFCGFGHHSGKLFWYEGMDPEKEHVLKDLPGARKAVVQDLNKDGKPDLIVLMTQAREEIVAFYNQGNGNFREVSLLQFPAVYGMTHFELTDMNGDGFPDILATNGDNWDLSPVLKNYHGIRIFLNNGRNQFKESWFYPLYGAGKAVAADFDGDGDMDIAAASFYTDLENPAHGFIYLSNEGNMSFRAYSTPEAAAGKWLTMEVADIDNNGTPDIVLGSYFQNFGEMTRLMFRGVTEFPQLLILKNKGAP